MLDKFWDGTIKLLFVKSAMDLIPGFRPLGKTPVQVQALLDGRETVRGEYVAKHTGLEDGQAAVREKLVEARREAVRAYALMKSTYADNPRKLETILRIPKGNMSGKAIVLRMEKTASVWEGLPNPPGSATPFTSNGLTRAQFIDLKDGFTGAVGSCTNCQTMFSDAKGALEEVERAQRNFISRALVQGRAQFDPGTPERAIIDGIPTEPSTQNVTGVQFDTVESQAEDAVHLVFHADHATAFRVEHKGPGDTGWTTVATLPAQNNVGDYATAGLPAGIHQYRVYGANSRGEGPVSTVQSIEVVGFAVA
jgi:hypothetical protein